VTRRRHLLLAAASLPVWHLGHAALTSNLGTPNPNDTADSTAPSPGGGYPSRPIRLVVPYAPGGGLTVVGRPLVQRLGELLGQPVVMDNRPGAGTTLGTSIVARAAADGYTLLFTLAAFAASPSVYANLSYDVNKDFEPISSVSASTSVLSVHPSLPIKTLPELVDYARKKAGGINYASSGTGGDQHLSIAALFNRLEAPATHIPFSGGGPAINALLGGQVDTMLVPASFGLPHILAGKLRPIAVTTPQRWKNQLTSVPSLAEFNLQDVDWDGWSGVFAPKGTPAPIVQRLNQAINTILAEPAFREYLATVHLRPLGGPAAQFAGTVRQDVQRWKTVVAQIGLKPE
jgi:tripartite-type tricarboxylate transporter receptor subunit TctC